MSLLNDSPFEINFQSRWKGLNIFSSEMSEKLYSVGLNDLLDNIVASRLQAASHSAQVKSHLYGNCGKIFTTKHCGIDWGVSWMD